MSKRPGHVNYVRSAKVTKAISWLFTLAATFFSVGLGSYSLRDKSYLYRFFGVILLFASSVCFLIGAFVVLHDREKHAGAYDRSPETMKKEARENKETNPAAIEKGSNTFSTAHQ